MVMSYEYLLTFIDLLTILRNFNGDSIRKLGIVDHDGQCFLDNGYIIDG